MRPLPSSQISIIAVGIENYQFLPHLRGPRRDVESFFDLMTNSPTQSLYNPSQVLKIIDTDSANLRKMIDDFVITRSAQGDVLIFYFSGHGVPVGHSDFGFCTSDTRTHDFTGSVLPFTVIRFRDLLESLRVMGITPIIIIDACYSGMVGKALSITPVEAISNMRSEITQQYATNYVLFCSCSDRQVSMGNGNGGYFSQAIFETLREGFLTRKTDESVMYIKDVYEEVLRRVSVFVADSFPQLFLGETMPAVPIIKNVRYTPMQEKISPYLGKIILKLWNDGNELELSGYELGELVGPGAYGNHSKLSLPGWDLLEDGKVKKKRRLTEKGRQFARGEISIPSKLIYDPVSLNYLPSPDAIFLSIDDLLGGKVE